MWSDSVLAILGTLIDTVVHLVTNLHLQRSAPGTTRLLVMDPSHSARAEADSLSFVAGAIGHEVCPMWI